MTRRPLRSAVTVSVAMVIALLTVATPLKSQDAAYPAHPISLYCAFPAGSISDIEARTLAQELSTELKQPVTVINVPGASSAIGASAFQQQPADGYSLFFDLVGYLAYVIASHKIGYTEGDFVPVGTLSNEGIALVGRVNDDRFDVLSKIVSYAKSHPNSLSIAGTGAQGVDALTYAELVKATNITATYVPYNGGNELVAAILGGHVDLGLTAPSNVINYVKNKQLNIYAVAASGDTYAPLPGVMTFEKAGYKFRGNFLRVLYVKKGTSPQILARLETALQHALSSPAWRSFEKRYVQEHVALSSRQTQVLMTKAVAKFTESAKRTK